MRPATLSRTAVLLLVVAAATYIASTRGKARAAAGPILLHAEAGATAQAEGAAADLTVRRSRLTRVNFDALPGPADRRMLREPAITLELFPDVTVFAEFVRFDPNPDGVTWVGRVEGVPMSSVTLVYAGGRMAGSIVLPNAHYQIRPAQPETDDPSSGGGALHVVTQVDQAAFLPEAAPIEVPAAEIAAESRTDAAAADSGDVIDLLVLYTPLAAAHAGGQTGIRNLINLGVSETNTSYANSGVNHRVRLVHSAEVPYTESSNFSTNLNTLRSGTGALAGVAALRDAHRADLVTMLVHPPGASACGIAFLMTSVGAGFAGSAFSVTDTACVSPNYTFAHELGHNMGARHDWYMDSATTPFTYAHGHVNPTAGQRWRTIMAYPDMCASLGFSCTRVLYWANPDQRYSPFCGRGFNCSQLQYWYFPGPPMGIAGGTSTACQSGNAANSNCDADDRRALNNTAAVIANFRQSADGR